MAIRARIDNTLKKFEKSLTTLNNITVSRSAILHNFDYFQGIYPTGFVIPVLKSNAYGHGLSVVATILKERKFPYIAVDGVYESLTIHNVSKQPVLVMGAIHPDNFSRMVFKRLAVVIHDPDADIGAVAGIIDVIGLAVHRSEFFHSERFVGTTRKIARRS